jgi:hypothetical protein
MRQQRGFAVPFIRRRCEALGVLSVFFSRLLVDRCYQAALLDNRADRCVPKGTDLSVYSQAKLNAVVRRLNERPRKTLDYETPAERFHQTIASTG